MVRGGVLAGCLGGVGLTVLAVAASVVASLMPNAVQLWALLNCALLLVTTMAIGGWAARLGRGRVVSLGGGLTAGAVAGSIAFGIRGLAQLCAAASLSYLAGSVVAASPFGTFEFSVPGLGAVGALLLACLAVGLLLFMGAILGGIGGLLYQALLAPEVTASATEPSSP